FELVVVDELLDARRVDDGAWRDLNRAVGRKQIGKRPRRAREMVFGGTERNGSVHSTWRGLRSRRRRRILRCGLRIRRGGRSPHKRRRENRSEEHTSELQSRGHLVCRLL